MKYSMNKPSTMLSDSLDVEKHTLYKIIVKEPLFYYILIPCLAIWINKMYNQWKCLETDIDMISLD